MSILVFVYLCIRVCVPSRWIYSYNASLNNLCSLCRADAGLTRRGRVELEEITAHAIARGSSRTFIIRMLLML